MGIILDQLILVLVLNVPLLFFVLDILILAVILDILILVIVSQILILFLLLGGGADKVFCTGPTGYVFFPCDTDNGSCSRPIDAGSCSSIY